MASNAAHAATARRRRRRHRSKTLGRGQLVPANNPQAYADQEIQPTTPPTETQDDNQDDGELQGEDHLRDAELVTKSYVGLTRAVIGQGFHVRELLFAQEFASLRITNWSVSTSAVTRLCELMETTARSMGLTESGRVVDHVEITSTATNKSVDLQCTSKHVAAQLYANLTSSSATHQFAIEPLYAAAVVNKEPETMEIVGCVHVSWAERFSTCAGKMLFASAATANALLESWYIHTSRAIAHLNLHVVGILPSASPQNLHPHQSLPPLRQETRQQPHQQHQQHQQYVFFDEAKIAAMEATQVSQLRFCVEIQSGLAKNADEQWLLERAAPHQPVDCVIERVATTSGGLYAVKQDESARRERLRKPLDTVVGSSETVVGYTDLERGRAGVYVEISENEGDDTQRLNAVCTAVSRLQKKKETGMSYGQPVRCFKATDWKQFPICHGRHKQNQTKSEPAELGDDLWHQEKKKRKETAAPSQFILAISMNSVKPTTKRTPTARLETKQHHRRNDNMEAKQWIPRGRPSGKTKNEDQQGEQLRTMETTPNKSQQHATPTRRNSQVWKQHDVERLKWVLQSDANHDTMPDHVEFAWEYQCARAESSGLRLDGKLRPMTKLEAKTLRLWRDRKIHLDELPAFCEETVPLETRMTLLQTQRDEMGYRLYLKLPPSFPCPKKTAKWHFCAGIMKQRKKGDGSMELATRLIHEAHTIMCDAASKLVILRYTRPEIRDAWAGETIPFPGGNVTLYATDVFANHAQADEVSANDVELLYQVDLIGNPSLAPLEILQIARALAPGTEILTVRAKDPRGVIDFGPHAWQIIYNTMFMPESLDNVRFLTVNRETGPISFGVFQPRRMRDLPCSRCLGLHYAKQCTHVADDEETATLLRKLRTPHEKMIQLDGGKKTQAPQQPMSSTELDEYLEALMSPTSPARTATPDPVLLHKVESSHKNVDEENSDKPNPVYTKSSQRKQQHFRDLELLQQHARAAKAARATGQPGHTEGPSTSPVSTSNEPTTASARKRLKMQRKRAARTERQRAGQEEAGLAAPIASATPSINTERVSGTHPRPVAKATEQEPQSSTAPATSGKTTADALMKSLEMALGSESPGIGEYYTMERATAKATPTLTRYAEDRVDLHHEQQRSPSDQARDAELLAPPTPKCEDSQPQPAEEDGFDYMSKYAGEDFDEDMDQTSVPSFDLGLTNRSTTEIVATTVVQIDTIQQAHPQKRERSTSVAPVDVHDLDLDLTAGDGRVVTRQARVHTLHTSVLHSADALAHEYEIGKLNSAKAHTSLKSGSTSEPEDESVRAPPTVFINEPKPVATSTKRERERAETMETPIADSELNAPPTRQARVHTLHTEIQRHPADLDAQHRHARERQQVEKQQTLFELLTGEATPPTKDQIAAIKTPVVPRDSPKRARASTTDAERLEMDADGTRPRPQQARLQEPESVQSLVTAATKLLHDKFQDRQQRGKPAGVSKVPQRTLTQFYPKRQDEGQDEEQGVESVRATSDAEVASRTTPAVPSNSVPTSQAESVQATSPRQESSPEVVPAPRLLSWAEIQEVFALREVDVPGKGSCFYFALHGIKNAGIPQVIKAQGWHLKEANCFKKHVNEVLIQRLETLFRTGKSSLDKMVVRFFDYSISPRDKAIEAVARELLKTSRHQSQNKLAWNRWAGAEEIFATVFYFREMIDVFDCLPTGEAYAQLYHLVWDEKHKEETVCITPIPTWEIGDHIRMHLEFHVVPLVLALHHSHIDGKPYGHYRAVRVQEDYYQLWSGADENGHTMKHRLQEVTRRLGLYVPPIREEDAVNHSPRSVSTRNDDSTYEPSEYSSSSALMPLTTRNTGPAQVTRTSTENPSDDDISDVEAEGEDTMTDDADENDADDEEDGEDEPEVTAEQQPAASAADSAAANERDAAPQKQSDRDAATVVDDEYKPATSPPRVPDGTRSTPYTHAGADPDQQREEHHDDDSTSRRDEEPARAETEQQAQALAVPPPSSGSQQPQLTQIRVDRYAQWLYEIQQAKELSGASVRVQQQAESANQAAYVQWRLRQRTARTKAWPLVELHKSLQTACTVLQYEALFFTDLLRQLPYVEAIYAAPCHAQALTNYGKAIIIAGRLRMLERMEEDAKTETARQFYRAWSTAIAASSSRPEVQWNLAHQADKWDQMRKFHRGQLPVCTIARIDDVNMARVVACAFSTPAALPEDWKTHDIGAQSDDFLMWARLKQNQESVRTIASAYGDRIWDAAKLLFSQEFSQGENRGHKDVASATPRC